MVHHEDAAHRAGQSGDGAQLHRSDHPRVTGFVLTDFACRYFSARAVLTENFTEEHRYE